MPQVKLTRVLTIVPSVLAVASTRPAAPKLFPARAALGQSLRRSTCLSVKG
jgi:hypothetical protein